MRRVIIVQARMASTRLPGKVLADLGGRPMLARQLERLSACTEADAICVATTSSEEDRPIVELARRSNVDWYRGSIDDVLGRFLAAARDGRADVVVRVTADCPLIDPATTDRVIRELVEHADRCDYASNVVRRTYPRGLDAEAMFVDTLARIDRLARSQPAREHVTIVPRSERPELFLRRDVVADQDDSDLRWTVDTPADLEMIRALDEELDLSPRRIAYTEIVRHIRQRPELAAINAGETTWSPT